MDYSDSFREKFDSLNVCIIIPTYNNEFTLARVIEEIAVFSQHIIVVNDGSTDGTLAIVEGFPFVQLITYKKNKGKGWALRKAFAYATERGYQYAISIDSDGQHFAKDLPAFIDKPNIQGYVSTRAMTIPAPVKNLDKPHTILNHFPGKQHIVCKGCFPWFGTI